MTSAAADNYDPSRVARPIRIVSAEPAGRAVLRVVFDDGVVREVDFAETIARSRWFRTLAEPSTFADLEVTRGGRALQWVTGADYCADALRMLADRQHAGRSGTGRADARGGH